MKSFLQNIFNRKMIAPPEVVQQKLEENFSGVINVEWNRQNDHYEAIFYKDQLEYIAVFSAEGELSEYKMSLSEELLPLPIKNVLTAKGEIMNVILRNKDSKISYEIIVRDAGLKRFLIVLAENGTIISEISL